MTLIIFEMLSNMNNCYILWVGLMNRPFFNFVIRKLLEVASKGCRGEELGT